MEHRCWTAHFSKFQLWFYSPAVFCAHVDGRLCAEAYVEDEQAAAAMPVSRATLVYVFGVFQNHPCRPACSRSAGTGPRCWGYRPGLYQPAGCVCAKPVKEARLIVSFQDAGSAPVNSPARHIYPAVPFRAVIIMSDYPNGTSIPSPPFCCCRL